jgi:hypothetical protein
MKTGAKVLRSAFWSGRLTYKMWRGMVRRGPETHRRIFVQAFLHLPMDWLLGELGDEKFISVWPQVREEFSGDSPFETAMRDAWDAFWGVRVAGDSQYPVRSGLADLPGKRREVLKAIVRNPGISVYALSRALHRDYSRVFKDVRLLIEMGEIQVRQDVRSNRKITRLLPVRSINTALAGIAIPGTQGN